MTQHRSIVLRTAFLAALGAAMLAAPGAAFAQSHEGGYLGIEPGAHQTASLTESVQPGFHPGSGQGGYLGLNAGATLVPARPASPTLAQEMADPIAWCVKSPDPDLCRAQAWNSHPICVADPAHYESCRYAMTQMWRP